MKKKVFLKAVVLITAMLLGLNSKACAENIAVIVNEKSPLLSESKLTLEIKEVRDIFLGKTKAWKGKLIKAANQKNKALLSVFLERVCNMRIPDYQTHWVKLELEQGLSSPKVFEAAKDVIRFVQSEKNAISYVLESEAKSAGANGDGIRIVLLLGE